MNLTSIEIRLQVWGDRRFKRASAVLQLDSATAVREYFSNVVADIMCGGTVRPRLSLLFGGMSL